MDEGKTKNERFGDRREPAPGPGQGQPVWEMVIQDMKDRDEHGRHLYGVPLQAHNGRNALVDAYQEALDLAVYLRQVIAEHNGAGDLPAAIYSPALNREALVELMHLARQEAIFDVDRMVTTMAADESARTGIDPAAHLVALTTYREILRRIRTLRDPEVTVRECSAEDIDETASAPGESS